MVRVKICCIRSLSEATLAIRLGAHALGLVSSMPSGPGIISEEEIGRIIAVMPPGITPVLLTSRQDPESLNDQLTRLAPQAVQLVLPVDPRHFGKLRKKFPSTRLIQVIHVDGPESILQAVEYAKVADALLLDSRIQRDGVTVYGGTGQPHDWNLSRQIVNKVGIPVFLAGGLTPENLRDAAKEVHPFGVDVCSGVRTQGILDEGKLTTFMNLAHLL